MDPVLSLERAEAETLASWMTLRRLPLTVSAMDSEAELVEKGEPASSCPSRTRRTLNRVMNEGVGEMY